MNLNHSNLDTHGADGTTPLPHTVSESVREAGAMANREAVRFGEMARHWWQRNAAAARDVAGNVKHEAVAIGDRTERYVRDEPVRSMLMAAAAGAVIAGLAMLLTRRGDR